ncbi:dihydrolipoyl dehydrogenase [Acidianus ambivalens]|uniref:Dihydrolipoyl dehydrogenase n=1 Tax=Acidianus ambivalens TaxID=2283 RepID=A0A650CVC8_ACIAM|nr:dihydrolipoyl dehydrogenase [Acidianus ambivalens]MQL55583.1 dihydrolipoyl dehydrogenase [Acidianus ambivalens]QGR21831.1 dihydrolipoyl dehydrogenase [Acidianus ambivalens]
MIVDVLIAGAGGAGYPAAFRLDKAGLKVVMADPKGELGGNCLYQGCVPSKTLRELAHLYVRAKKLLGFNETISFEKAQDHKDFVQETRFKQHKQELAESSVEFYKGEVEIIDNHHAVIKDEKGDVQVEYKYLILATGSEPFKPKFPGSEYCITSDDLYKYKTSIRKLPKEMVIIGGGYIALETASIMNALGTKVHVLVRSDRVLRGLDSRLVSSLLSMLDKNIDIRFNSPVIEVQKIGDKDEYKVIYSEKSEKKEISADLVMLATGRRPVYPKGTEKLGLAIGKTGIMVDETIVTSVKNIYAPGDVNGRSMFFHSAVRQSLVSAHNILAGTPIDYMDFQSVPISVFTIPSIAYVGILPEEAKRRGIDIIEASYPLSKDSRAQMYDEAEGEVRLFFERGSLRIIGGWIIGIDAPTMINEIGTAVANGLTARQMANYADQHPMSNESISYAARSIF